MTVLLIIVMLLAFVGLDYLVREGNARLKVKQDRLQREAILASAVRIEFAGETKSLKRVQVPNAKARILAVDDEGVVLDSFRRILVLEGFDIDTVETGPEALTLVQRNDYDFVFTDLKMPNMDGVEVVKAVKHLRPDVDVVVITGYGTIETAVATLQHGACEYTQKPFTADELGGFVNKLLVRRQARQEAENRPTVRIVAPSEAEGAQSNEFCVPGGAFVAPGHTWARIEPEGQVRIGLDDFGRKAIGAMGLVELPETGHVVTKGDALFSFKRGSETLVFKAPVSGMVVECNQSLTDEPSRVVDSPYREGWICRIQPSNLMPELAELLIGQPVVAWYGEELIRLRQRKPAAARVADPLAWSALQEFMV